MVTIPLKQCVPRVLKLASIIQNKSKIRFHKYQRDCLINKNYIALFRVFLDHPSYRGGPIVYFKKKLYFRRFQWDRAKHLSGKIQLFPGGGGVSDR